MSRLWVLGLAAVLVLASNGTAFGQDRAKGEQVYAAQKCSICHAIAGKGNSKGALDDVGSRLSPDEIRQWIADAKGMTAKTKATRKPEMRVYSLPKEEVDSLVAYLSALKKK